MVRRESAFVVLVLTLLLGGCAATQPERTSTVAVAGDRSAVPGAAAGAAVPAIQSPAIQLAAHAQESQAVGPPAGPRAGEEVPAGRPSLMEYPPSDATDFLSPAGTLDIDRVVGEVVARNPSVQAMIAAWQAAAARYPQVVALDDPMLDSSVGPGSWGNPTVDSAYMVMASQKLPWRGKRQLRGAVAGAEASGAATGIDDIELRLTELARLACYDYFAAWHELALNSDNERELRKFRDTAEAKLRAALVTQQDVLQADVELALLDRRRNELQRAVRVAAARINTLLNRAADIPLPPPPPQLGAAEPVPSVDQLLATAIGRRPDLAALAAQIRADQASVALAWREFYPDVDLYGKYDAFWQEHPLRTAVGLNVNVPLQRSRRYAAVREAQSRLRQRRSEYERLVDEISNEVHAGFQRLQESRRTSRLFDQRIVPAATLNVESAHAGYVSGKVDFLRLIEAQRQLIALREQQVEVVSDYHRRLAELRRAAALPDRASQDAY